MRESSRALYFMFMVKECEGGRGECLEKKKFYWLQGVHIKKGNLLELSLGMRYGSLILYFGHIGGVIVNSK